MKKVLILASVASMIDQFNMPNIKLLQEMGYAVDVACNFKEGNTCSKEKIDGLQKTLKKMNVRYFQIDFARNITSITRNMKAFKQVKKLLKENKYTFLHCHSPIGGVVGRIAGKITKTKVIYTAHGFHFYKGAPLKNWLIYYPVEKICSYMTDVLICINKEDYALAQKKMKAGKIVYVPGVGIELGKFKDEKNTYQEIKAELRKKLNIGEKEVLLLSVGELNKNKNHSLVIKAMGEMLNHETESIHYAVAGQGNLQHSLLDLAKNKGIEDNVHFFGFQSNIQDWYKAADIFIFPSFREGLSVALMEAMASGLPCVVSKIRGNIDLIDKNGGCFFEANDEKEFIKVMQKVIQDRKLRAEMGKYNQNKIKKFGREFVNQEMKKIYQMGQL